MTSTYFELLPAEVILHHIFPIVSIEDLVTLSSTALVFRNILLGETTSPYRIIMNIRFPGVDHEYFCRKIFPGYQNAPLDDLRWVTYYNRYNDYESYPVYLYSKLITRVIIKKNIYHDMLDYYVNEYYPNMKAIIPTKRAFSGLIRIIENYLVISDQNRKGIHLFDPGKLLLIRSAKHEYDFGKYLTVENIVYFNNQLENATQDQINKLIEEGLYI